MRALVRLLLLWILILSLPLRAVGAEIALPCRMPDTSAANPATKFIGVCDHHETIRAAVPEAHPAPVDKGADSAHSPRRVCCVSHVGVSAPPPLAVTVPLAAHVVRDHISPISSCIGWIPSRLERPPRA
jgi:hypothetical protein